MRKRLRTRLTPIRTVVKNELVEVYARDEVDEVVESLREALRKRKCLVKSQARAGREKNRILAELMKQRTELVRDNDRLRSTLSIIIDKVGSSIEDE